MEAAEAEAEPVAVEEAEPDAVAESVSACKRRRRGAVENMPLVKRLRGGAAAAAEAADTVPERATVGEGGGGKKAGNARGARSTENKRKRKRLEELA